MQLRYSVRFLLALPVWCAVNILCFFHLSYFISLLPLANIVAIGLLLNRAIPLTTTLHVDNERCSGRVSLLNVVCSSASWALILNLLIAFCRPSLFEYFLDVLVWDQMIAVVSMLGLSGMPNNPNTGMNAAEDLVLLGLAWLWLSLVPLLVLLSIQLAYLTKGLRLRFFYGRIADPRRFAVSVATSNVVQPRRTYE